MRNHSAQGASSSLSTCRCQPDVPPWLVSRGGWRAPGEQAVDPLRGGGGVPGREDLAQVEGGLAQFGEVGG